MKHGSLYHLPLPVKDRHLPERYLGRQIGKYRITRLLGGGTFSWVYEAIDRDLEIPVALKILRPEFAGQPDAEARFRREAATAARLRHPNIVTVRDVGQVDNASFVAMDLQPLSLARRLELLTRLSEADTVRLGLDVAAALAVAHAGGIVHRDIKPDNILIGTRGEAVVADFGLARTLDADAARNSGQQVMGTPHYFSPEQARGLELDGRSDLYSLGVTLFRTATGRLPFEGDDWYAVARQHVDTLAPRAREIAPELSEAFDALVSRLLSKSPDERFASALALADALAALPSAPNAITSTTPSGGTVTETVTAFAPVAPVAPRSARTRVLFAVGAVAIGVTAWWAYQLPAVQSRVAALPIRTTQVPDSTEIKRLRDSLAAFVADSVQRADSISRSKIAKPDSAGSAAGDRARRQAAAAVRTEVTVSANDSAVIYVDGVVVGRGSAVISRPGAAQLALRAVIADAPVNCPSAQRDSIVRVRVGDRPSVALLVRTCLPFRFRTRPSDARVRFESLDGGTSIEVRADTIASLWLPAGRYEIRASATRCFDYRGDFVTVRRGLPPDSLSRVIPLQCQ